MSCFEYQQRLQRRLDGAPDPETAVSARHLAECAECRALEAAVGRLEEGLRLRPPAPPAGLVERIVERILTDRRDRTRLRWRPYAAAAFAASLLLATFFGYTWWAANGTRTTPVVRNHDDPPREPPRAGPTVDESVEELRSALAGVWNVTTDQALGPARVLRSATVSVPAFPEAGTWPAEAPVGPLQEVQEGVPDLGLVASLGRFVNYFMQELPETKSSPNRGL